MPWLSEHHGTWARPDEDVIRDLALLGVTSSDPVVGLGRAGRAMLATSMSAAEVAVGFSFDRLPREPWRYDPEVDLSR